MQTGYLDNAATSELCTRAKAAIINAVEVFGNPSSFYSLGQSSADIIESAKKTIADFIKATPNEIYFTSGGTESDNLAIIGSAGALKRRGNRIVTTSFEHSAVLGAVDYLEKQGFDVVRLEPDESGSVPLSAFESAINDKTILVSCMAVNNETGAELPVEKIKPLIKKIGAPAYLHVDDTQGFGKYPLYPERCGIDLMTFSSHKIHGPKGVGALYIKKGVRILPLINGGEQQNGLRPGTEPVILIAGFSAAVDDIGDMSENVEKVKKLRDYTKTELLKIDGILINSPDICSEYVLNITVCGYKSETLLHFLDSRGVYVSSGSACAKGKPSHVLSAMGFDKRRIDSAVRVSFSKYSTKADCDMLIDGLKQAKQTLIKVK